MQSTRDAARGALRILSHSFCVVFCVPELCMAGERAELHQPPLNDSRRQTTPDTWKTVFLGHTIRHLAVAVGVRGGEDDATSGACWSGASRRASGRQARRAERSRQLCGVVRSRLSGLCFALAVSPACPRLLSSSVVQRRHARVTATASAASLRNYQKHARAFGRFLEEFARRR